MVDVMLIQLHVHWWCWMIEGSSRLGLKVSSEDQGSLVFSVNHSSLHIFYSETQISNWLSLCSPIVFLIVRSELEQLVPPLARHLAGILNSQQNLSPSQKHCHLLAGMKKCVALLMICWADGSSTFLVHKPFSKRLRWLWNHVVRRFPSYIHVFWIRWKLLIRTIIHTSGFGCTYNLEQIQLRSVIAGANTCGRLKNIESVQLWKQKWKHRSQTHSGFLASCQHTSCV